MAAIPLTVLFLTKGKAQLKDMVVSGRAILLMGIFYGLALFVGTKAVATGKVTFVTVIVSLNVLVTIVLSGTFFKEKGLIKHFVAGFIMLVAAALIALSP